jgi:hypothetical protein
VTIARGSVGRATGQAHDRPVILLEQPLDDVAPDDPERSDDDGLLALCHGTLPVAHDRPAASKSLPDRPGDRISVFAGAALFTVHQRELIQADASLKGLKLIQQGAEKVEMLFRDTAKRRVRNG